MREIEFNLDENPFYQHAMRCLQESMLKRCGTGAMKMTGHFS